MSGASVAAVYGAFQVASSVANAMGNYGEQKRLEKLNQYNSAVTAERIKALNYEEAMNETLRRLNAYSEIGAGKNAMSSTGNIGSSADAAVINAYMNLAGDLAAMSFNYENERVDLRTERNNYLYHAMIAKAQKKSAIIGGTLGAGGSALQAYSGYSAAGGKYGAGSKYWDVASYYDEYGDLQETWHKGVFSDVFGSTNSNNSGWAQAVKVGRAYDSNGNVVSSKRKSVL